MVQLKKASNPIFHGNGLGATTAGWTVKGSEHIAVRQLGTTWVAVDTSKDGAKLAIAFDRQSLISKLEAIELDDDRNISDYAEA